MIFEVIFVLLALLCFVSFYFRYSPAGRLIARVPGPKILPLVGNCFDISLDPESFFQFTREMAKKYGGSVSRLTGFNQRGINIYEPEDIQIILTSTKYDEKPLPYTFLRPWLGEGLLTSRGSKWQHRRKLLTPAYHFTILKKFLHTFNEHTEELIEQVKETVGDQRTDVTPLITNATLKIMCETSMGISKKTNIQSISGKYSQALHTLGKCLAYRLSKIYYFPDFLFNFSKTARIQNKALENLHGFTNKIIQSRRERTDNLKTEYNAEDDEMYGNRSKMALLDLLLDQEKEGNIDEQGIREEVDTFMFEGHDTTAATLRFMLMRIANEPVVQDRIYDEMKSLFGDSNRAPTMEDFNEMKYLERCIKEALRLYPGVPYVARMLREDIVLGGYTIPADTICNIHIFDVHRREKLFPNPEVFDPDRFLPANVMNIHPFAYIPFSAGPRNCIGQKFAMLELKTVMSGLLRRFILEPVTKPEDIVFAADVVLQTHHPIYVRFLDRIY